MKKSVEPSLKITYDAKSRYIMLEALKQERFEHHGFGTFLCDIKPGEVQISAEALEVLMGCPYRSGMQGLEIWSQNRIAWASPNLRFMLLAEDVSRESGAAKWLKKCHVEKVPSKV